MKVFVIVEYLIKPTKESEVSIAIRPFWNSSSNGGSNNILVDGMLEDIRANLEQIKGLRVISKGTMLKYRETTLSTPEIASELDVNYILEGTAQIVENLVKIHARLIFCVRSS